MRLFLAALAAVVSVCVLASPAGAHWSQTAPLSAGQRSNAGLIIDEGRALHANQRALRAAVLTSYHETHLRNLGYGDRSSVGLFQQLWTWGPAYLRLRPRWAARQFFVGFRGYRYYGALHVMWRYRYPASIALHVQNSGTFSGFAAYGPVAGRILRAYRFHRLRTRVGRLTRGGPGRWPVYLGVRR